MVLYVGLTERYERGIKKIKFKTKTVRYCKQSKSTSQTNQMRTQWIQNVIKVTNNFEPNQKTVRQLR